MSKEEDDRIELLKSEIKRMRASPGQTGPSVALAKGRKKDRDEAIKPLEVELEMLLAKKKNRR